MRPLTAAKSAGTWSFSEPCGRSHTTTPCKHCQAQSLRGLLSKAPSLPLTMTSNAGERGKKQNHEPISSRCHFSIQAGTKLSKKTLGQRAWCQRWRSVKSTRSRVIQGNSAGSQSRPRHPHPGHAPAVLPPWLVGPSRVGSDFLVWLFPPHSAASSANSSHYSRGRTSDH